MDMEEPIKPSGYVLGSDVSEFGVDELDEVIAALHEEVSRLEAEKSARSGTRAAADALFGRKT